MGYVYAVESKSNDPSKKVTFLAPSAAVAFERKGASETNPGKDFCSRRIRLQLSAEITRKGQIIKQDTIGHH